MPRTTATSAPSCGDLCPARPRPLHRTPHGGGLCQCPARDQCRTAAIVAPNAAQRRMLPRTPLGGDRCPARRRPLPPGPMEATLPGPRTPHGGDRYPPWRRPLPHTTATGAAHAGRRQQLPRTAATAATHACMLQRARANTHTRTCTWAAALQSSTSIHVREPIASPARALAQQAGECAPTHSHHTDPQPGT
jgi:hypothetical protein